MSTWTEGNKLSHKVQQECLAKFVHRFTRDHKPEWARKTMPNGRPYTVQFASDADWLAHTLFAVTKRGTLDTRVHHCISSPTWPDGAP